MVLIRKQLRSPCIIDLLCMTLHTCPAVTKMGVCLLPLYLHGHWKLSTSVKEWADLKTKQCKTKHHNKPTKPLCYIYFKTKKKKRNQTNKSTNKTKQKPQQNKQKQKRKQTKPSLFLFIVFIDPLDSIGVNALAKHLQIYCQAFHVWRQADRFCNWKDASLAVIESGSWKMVRRRTRQKTSNNQIAKKWDLI